MCGTTSWILIIVICVHFQSQSIFISNRITNNSIILNVYSVNHLCTCESLMYVTILIVDTNDATIEHIVHLQFVIRLSHRSNFSKTVSRNVKLEKRHRALFVGFNSKIITYLIINKEVSCIERLDNNTGIAVYPCKIKRGNSNVYNVHNNNNGNRNTVI